MAKIVRLTESDLTRLVKRVIREMDSDMPRKSRGILGHRDSWYDEMDSPTNPDEFEDYEEFEFGPDDFEEYLKHTSDIDNKWDFKMQSHKGDYGPGQRLYGAYTKDGPLTLRKKRMTEQPEGYGSHGEKTFQKIKEASKQEVDRFLENLPENTRFIQVSNCEYADFSSIDICSFPNLTMISLKGTENNFDEQNYDCPFTHFGNGIYDFTPDY